MHPLSEVLACLGWVAPVFAPCDPRRDTESREIRASLHPIAHGSRIDAEAAPLDPGFKSGPMLSEPPRTFGEKGATQIAPSARRAGLPCVRADGVVGYHQAKRDRGHGVSSNRAPATSSAPPP